MYTIERLSTGLPPEHIATVPNAILAASAATGYTDRAYATTHLRAAIASLRPVMPPKASSVEFANADGTAVRVVLSL
jgi:hypothetical protein